MEKSKVIGAWKLISHGFRQPDGQFKATSEFLLGQLVYEESGAMSVLIITEAVPEALSQIIAYSGWFTLESDQITHHITVASKMERVNTAEVRNAQLFENYLILRTPKTDRGFFEIKWQKITKKTSELPFR